DLRLFAYSRRVGLEAWRAQRVVRRSRAVRSRQGPPVHLAHGSGWGCCSPPLPGARWRQAHGFAPGAPGGGTSACWSGRRPACWRTERACWGSSAAGDDVVAGCSQRPRGRKVTAAPGGGVSDETEDRAPRRTDQQAAYDQPDPGRAPGEQPDEKADEQAEPGTAGRARG